MKRVIAFDMDGTIADLFHVENWCERIHSNDVSPYEIAKPMYNMEKLNNIIKKLQSENWDVIVITWLAMGESSAFNAKVSAVKRQWINRYLPAIRTVYAIENGVEKSSIIANDYSFGILIDDNNNVREQWKLGMTINAKKDIMPELEKLIAS